MSFLIPTQRAGLKYITWLCGPKKQKFGAEHFLNFWGWSGRAGVQMSLRFFRDPVFFPRNVNLTPCFYSLGYF